MKKKCIIQKCLCLYFADPEPNFSFHCNLFFKCPSKWCAIQSFFSGYISVHIVSIFWIHLKIRFKIYTHRSYAQASSAHRSAPMGLAPLSLAALGLCVLDDDISIPRIWDPIGSCDRQSQLGIIPPLIENFKYVFRSKTCCDIIYVSITYFRVEKLSSVPISILLCSGRNLKPKERDKWHKTIKIKSFMVRSDRSKARGSNDQMTTHAPAF